MTTFDSGPPSIEIKRDNVYLFPESACAVHTFLDRPRELLLVEQWRAAHQRHTLELPGGRVEPEESAQAAALRELKEETGIAGQIVKYVLKLDLDFSASKHSTHLVHTRSKFPDYCLPSCRFLSAEECWNAITSGRISHAPTVVAVLLVLKGEIKSA